MTDKFALPASLEAEQGVLGSMLISPKEATAEAVSAGITDGYFFYPAHQIIYASLVELWLAGKDIDFITFTQILRDKNLLENIGGAAVVTNLFTCVPTAANISYYIDILRDKYILREIIAAGTEAVRRANEDQDDVGSVLHEIQEKIGSIGLSQDKGRKSLKQLAQEKLERMQRGKQDEDVIKTGIKKLDYYSPLRDGDMPVLSGETKSGKTIVSLTIAQNVASSGHGVAIFGLESSVHEIVDRLFAGVSRIPQQKLDHTANLTDDELHKVARAAQTIGSLPLYLYDDIFDLHHIIAEARRLKAQRAIRLIIIDYAQLVRTQVARDKNREQEVANISRSFRLLALELKIPVILISQLNEDGRSRESRSLENDCTAFWHLLLDEKIASLRHLSIPFQRNGESLVKFPLTFLGHFARVENCEPDEEL